MESKKSKEALKQESPELYDYFNGIWEIRNCHMVTGLPHYVFMLLCCYKPDCKYPCCLHAITAPQAVATPRTWYAGGPPLTHLPLPKPDPDRPWGGPCSTCKDCCGGHYSEPVFTDVTDASTLKLVSSPPSVYLKELFTELHKQGKSITDNVLEEAAKKVLLPTQEVGFWFDHLKSVADNRQRGAMKAAETRRRKRQATSYFCGTCEREYREEVAGVDFWIFCDFCKRWYCCLCQLLSVPPTTDTYKCLSCK